MAIPPSGGSQRVVATFKRSGSMTLARALAGALKILADTRSGQTEDALLVIPPTRRSALRRRGFHPVALVTRAAGLRAISVGRVRTGVRDQRGLGAQLRADNIHGAFQLRAHDRRRIAGARVVLLDDVLTTGATLAELERLCRSAGATVVEHWAISCTPVEKVVV
ncbi:MAG TPA: phosphoribosyltransferase family protein [Microbacteriaceae bacterium]|nr:phosphoribosyltransferase family protein [Microbacteriaceae bacterium]